MTISADSSPEMMAPSVALVMERPKGFAEVGQCRLEQAEQHGDGRGLAGAVAAQQADDGTRRGGEAQIVDGDDLAVHLPQMPDLDGRRLGHRRIIAP